jgi:formiminotetrahydrofolate cyclodeaminase
LASRAISQGNQNALSDGAVGVLASRTAALAALYNVKINLSAIKDPDLVKELTRESENLETQVIKKEKDILAHINI